MTFVPSRCPDCPFPRWEEPDCPLCPLFDDEIEPEEWEAEFDEV